MSDYKAINLEYMDKSVRPQDDFYRFVNGAWIDKTEIPADQPSWGSFNELRKKTDMDMLALLGEAMKDADSLGVDEQKAVNYFANIMDVAARNAQGTKPLLELMAEIEAIATPEALDTFMHKMPLRGLGANPFYTFYTMNDFADSSVNAGYLVTPRLSLPRDYYVDEDDDTVKKRAQYKAYVEQVLVHLGKTETEAATMADGILSFETFLASKHMTKEDARDARKQYNPHTYEQLKEHIPSVNWDEFFAELGVKDLKNLIVTDKGYFSQYTKNMKDYSFEQMKLLVLWTVINHVLGSLDEKSERIKWEFYGKTIQGATEPKPLNERALATVNGSIGEALGKLYVGAKFPPEAKAKAQDMIAHICEGFKIRINQLPWMSEETKKKALEKLEKFTVKVAYPDVWKDFSDLKVTRAEDGGSYFVNLLEVEAWETADNIKKLGKRVDRNEWEMSPQTVNAYFHPLNNEIVFPAAILQAPFYDYRADEAVNYGGIGVVIGHEISHSFDDSGARFDGDGNLNNWWTDEDAAEFEKAGKMLVKQFDDIVILGDVHLNGTFTLGENIGDLGGLLAALEGLKLFYKEHGRPEDLDGFSPEQRFFISNSTVWRGKSRDEYLRLQVKSDPHAPMMFRGCVPFTNIDAFYEAFGIKEGDKMYLAPEDRVRIW